MSLLEEDIASAWQPIAANRPHRFTLGQYYRLSEMGFFSQRKVEFIDGEIIEMAAQLNPHSFVISELARWFFMHCPKHKYWVRIQTSLRTDQSSPEPDFAILHGPANAERKYATADDAAWVIEVADTTLLYDTVVKAPLYAASKVPEYWVVSVPDRHLIVYRNPIESASAAHGWMYATTFIVKPAALAHSLLLPDYPLDPGTVLP
jgi:Uma2 family endonuclease